MLKLTVCIMMTAQLMDSISVSEVSRCTEHSNNFGSRCFCFGAAQQGAKLTFECSCKISWLGLPGLNNLFYVCKTSLNCSVIQQLPK